MKRTAGLLIALVLLFTVFACAETINVSALNGPTGIGMAKLMKDGENGDTYSFTLAGSADMITPKLIKGEIDIACVPANLASVLYNKTNGNIRVLAINTLGVLYIVEKGESIKSFSDLKGRVIYASGMGATPEYALRYLLTMNGLDPEKDVTIVWKSEQAECLAALIRDDTACALLPQPFVSAAQAKNPDIRVCLDLTKEWDALGLDSQMIQGVVVARGDFADANPEAVKAFLEAYAESVAFVNENPEAAAALVGEYGIVAESVALKALPYCHIVFIAGDEMRGALSGYLNVLYEINPASVGGRVPDEAFYYTIE